MSRDGLTAFLMSSSFFMPSRNELVTEVSMLHTSPLCLELLKYSTILCFCRQIRRDLGAITTVLVFFC
ncbi:hypothetical protein BRADI_4g33891v3 [Brachypodium distachyon]|uniref:Uncharacterized protein n=1 Tax=Brachypodium distachyon TaxID=15368 RepID=A0A2K2CS37_BRADI|nr:hypothetical protein BRADI_4g33891v3 [Brachypodium distachyon]